MFCIIAQKFKRSTDKIKILKNSLKEKRTLKKISQEELARMVDTTRQTIISIEKNQFNPSGKIAFFNMQLACNIVLSVLFSNERECENKTREQRAFHK